MAESKLRDLSTDFAVKDISINTEKKNIKGVLL